MEEVSQSTQPPAPFPETLALRGVAAGSYRLERLLGRGGLASVWLARHPTLGSTVAVKVLHRTGAEARARLEQEAGAVNRLRSPYILPILDIGTLADDHPYALMECLRGETLATRLRREGSLSWRCAHAIATQIAEALLTAHAAGVIHRDLKPDNVFLVAGPSPELPQVRLLDFGIAEVFAESARGIGQSPRPAIHGTPHYIAPEQALGEPCGPSADIYAFGTVIFEMLAGKPPFEGNVTQLLAAKCRRQPPRLDGLRSGLADGLVELVDHMLAADPEQRPISVEVVAALRAAAPRCADAACAAAAAETAPEPGTRRPATATDETGGSRHAVAATEETEVIRPFCPEHPAKSWRRIAWPAVAVGFFVGLIVVLAVLLGGSPREAQETIVVPAPAMSPAPPPVVHPLPPDADEAPPAPVVP